MSLAKRGLKTIMIDVDLEAPSLIHLLPPKSNPSRFWPDYLDEGDRVQLGELIQQTSMDNLDVIYTSSPEMGKKFLQTKQRNWWEQALKHSLMAQKKLYEMGYDFIILDNQSGTSMNSVNNMILADISVLIVRPTHYGVDATETFVQELYRILRDMKPRKDYFVWNQVPDVSTPEEQDLLNRFIDKWNRRLEGMGLHYGATLPLDRMFNLQLLNDMVEAAIFSDSLVGHNIDEFVDKMLKE